MKDAFSALGVKGEGGEKRGQSAECHLRGKHNGVSLCQTQGDQTTICGSLPYLSP